MKKRISFSEESAAEMYECLLALEQGLKEHDVAQYDLRYCATYKDLKERLEKFLGKDAARICTNVKKYPYFK